MKAIHFGAGNIGRGFVGMLLRQAGMELVFADVAEGLIESLQQADSYRVHGVGTDPFDVEVSGFRAINSNSDTEALIAELATADLITTAVGVQILKFVAPVIAAGLTARDPDAPRVAILACENAINATDTLRATVQEDYEGDDLEAKAIFANTAIDRIVPAQAADAGLDVTVETFFEWVVEEAPFSGEVPAIPGVTWVQDLRPYIERKLFTVNTGHAITAWHGWAAGVSKISDAIRDESVSAKVEGALAETSALLVAKHEFDQDVQRQYVAKNLERFANPHLPDTVERVGRSPLRKLSRHDRIIGPAAELAERGLPYGNLLEAFAAALRFDVAEDPEVAQLKKVLQQESAEAATTTITGLEPGHPLYEAVRDKISDHLRASD